MINNKEGDVHWNDAYWGIQSQFYWDPTLIGLDSVSAKNCVQENGHLLLPLDAIRTDGSIYWRRRGEDAASTKLRLHRLEVVLNHCFNIMSAIAPDEVLQQLLLHPLGFDEPDSFTPVGDQLWRRYGWSESANVTQPDGLFLGDQSVVAVELKLDATTDAAQVLKYATLLAMEEKLSGPKERLGLLYIVPEHYRPALWKKISLSGPAIDRTYMQHLSLIKPGNVLNAFIRENQDLLASVLDRMALQVISWRDVLALFRKIEAGLDLSHRGDQTLGRLLAGFCAQLEAHQKTGI